MPEEATTPATQALVAKIVGSYVKRNAVAPTDLPTVILSVHQALVGLETPALATPEQGAPAVPVRRSVQQGHVTCLDCGWRGQTLRRHLFSAHGLSPEDYRERWQLSRNHPLVAPNYAARRSALAKQGGLGRSRNPQASGA